MVKRFDGMIVTSLNIEQLLTGESSAATYLMKLI